MGEALGAEQFATESPLPKEEVRNKMHRQPDP
jgi:hypothetical protein